MPGFEPVCIHVCASCEAQTTGEPTGQQLYKRLCAASAGSSLIAVRAAPCFAVCERPVTIAFSSPGKWTYVIGDVAADIDTNEVLAAANAVGTSPSGVPPMNQRPDFFRRGVIARVPPTIPPEPPA